MRLIGVYAPGEDVPIDEANEALMVFNDMVDGWNADRLAIFTTRIDDFPFTLNKQSYTMGTGGDFNVPRPARIDAMSAILLNNPSNPVEIPMDLYSVDDWQLKIPVKNVSSSFPQICYDDGGFPFRTLNMWPIPTSANAVRIYSWQALAAAAALNTTIAFPPGYPEAFRYNLAVRLGSEFAAPVSDIVQRIAIQSLGRLKTMNAPDLNLQSDLVASPAGYNYKADLFGIGL